MVGLVREDLAGAVALLLRETASDPRRTMRHAQEIGQDVVKITTGQSELAPDPKDKRFKDPAWQYNPFLKAGAQYYLAVQKGMKNWLEDLELDAVERDRANFISQIIIEQRLEGTEEVAGSWWPFWIDWLQRRSGAKKKAPAELGGKGLAPSDPAPGLYVREQS